MNNTFSSSSINSLGNLTSSSSSDILNSSSTSNSRSWGWSTWLVIILILAFLGFNIFIYLAKGTQIFANLSAKIASIFGTGVIDVTKQVVNVAATGTKAAADITAGTVDTTLTYAENAASQISQANNSQQQKLNASLNQANKLHQGNNEEDGYTADEASSSIQSSKSSGKSGWCYIGEDRGFRSCIKVGENDQCMSGDIYPSQQICMYPDLRP